MAEVLNPQSLDIYCFWKSGLRPNPLSAIGSESGFVSRSSTACIYKKPLIYISISHRVWQCSQMCKCFLGRHGAYWLSSSFGGAFVTKGYITPACAWQRESSLVSALLSPLINSSTISQTQWTRCSQPPPPCLSWLVSLPWKNTYFWFTYIKTAIPGMSTEKGWSLPSYFHTVYLTFPNMSFKYNQGASRASKGDIIQGLSICQFVFYLYPPTLLLCLFVDLPLPTTHLLSFTSVHPVSLCAGAWTVSAACNTNYCAALGSKEHRGEIREVWNTTL